jgi:hypothetical protein
MALADQIYVWRQLANIDGVYQHHGIDMGDGSVIHYRKPSEIIEQTSWETFSRGNKVYIRQYPQGFSFLSEVVIKRAISRLGENKYNLLFNNCEHFATWCKTGISKSQQIIDFLPAINKLDTYKLFNPLKKAFQGVDNKQQMNNLIDDALEQIRDVWNRIQPQYRHALDEMGVWHQVAFKALQNNREDLAREALKRKKEYEKKARKLEKELEKLAIMTENLLQNHINS